MTFKYKHEIVLGSFLIGFVTAFYFLYGLILPFMMAILFAFACDASIARIMRLVKNRDVATSIFLAVIIAVIALFLLTFAQFMKRDIGRLNHSFTILISENKETRDEIGQKARDYLSRIYDFKEIENQLRQQADTFLNDLQQMDYSEADAESLKESFDKILSAFQKNEPERTDSAPSRFGFWFMFFSFIGYFVLILFQLEYFKSLRDRYIRGKLKSRISVIFDDFTQSFLKYFKLRSRIVFILLSIYLIAFVILDLPGTMLFLLLILILSYVPYLQYLVLIPLTISSYGLAIELDQSFLLIFGIVVGIFVLASVVEEVFLNPRIMEKNIGMNPVIMIFSLSIWSYLLGMPGLLIGVPVTSLLIIYFKRYFLPEIIKSQELETKSEEHGKA